MGSGCARDELGTTAKKAREGRRRERQHAKRLIALGMPADQVKRLNALEMRRLLIRPERTRLRYAGKA